MKLPVSADRRLGIGVGCLLIALAIAAPAFSASPDPSASAGATPTASDEASPSAAASGSTAPSGSASAGPTGSAAPSAAPRATAAPQSTAEPDADESGKPDKGPKDKEGKGPEVAVTLRGTVAASTDGKGRPSYTLTAGGKTYELSDGPPWWWGTSNPLAAYVGKTVDVTGSQRQGSTEVDVEAVNGKAVRAPGRPPWAGGPAVVGEKHPGWKAWKLDANGKRIRGHGRSAAPGQLKDRAPETSGS